VHPVTGLTGPQTGADALVDPSSRPVPLLDLKDHPDTYPSGNARNEPPVLPVMDFPVINLSVKAGAADARLR